MIKIYSIGEISKMVKISSDTLRYYDEIQLLNPDYINPSNNYRFYNEKQVKELLYIMELKDCGFNLEEIKKILKLKDETKIKKLFAKKKTDLLTQSKKINSSIEIIEHKLKLMEEKDMKEKILIVDDAPFMRMMVKDILTKNGYETVIEAEDGNDGIVKFMEHKPTLTLMDITMPNMDGISATKKIKEIDSSAKIIMLSAMGQPSYVVDCFSKGAVDFIVKPFQADRLVITVAKHLKENVELDLEEIKLWQSEFNQESEIKPETVIVYDEKILSEKLLETVKECINASAGISYEVLTRILMDRVKEFVNPGAKVKGDKLTQDEINTLVTRFTKE